MEHVVRGGIARARGEVGHGVKVQVRGLAPDRWYYYRFEAGSAVSVVGRLRTAPAQGSIPDRLRYAFASCQQRTASYYVAHRAIANDDVDFLLHLGDYIYVHDTRTLTLDDYRSDWRRFHSNPILQDLQAKVPLVAVWDDGEFYNGVDRTGPPERLAAARAAFFEHMPVRRRRDDRDLPQLPLGQARRRCSCSTRARIAIPKCRRTRTSAGSSTARTPRCRPASRCSHRVARRSARGRSVAQERRPPHGRDVAAGRQLVQRQSLEDHRPRHPRAARRRSAPPANGGIYVSNEAWDDYQAERRELLEYLLANGVRNVVFTSGHTHIYLASELQPDFDDPASPVAAFDFTTGSQTADPDPRTIAPEEVLHLAEQVMMDANTPYLRHVDLLNQGYALVDVTPEELVVEFRVLDTFDPDAEARTAARFRILNGGRSMDVQLFP